jgi:uncharacterized 2Fe-2S/4Fe-4S cluster protein (DUF4445 family)
MRAAAGAIGQVTREDGSYRCHVLGGGAPRGLCGSGLVSAVACALDAGDILPSGRLKPGLKELSLAPQVALAQSDIRELQLAKAAIAAGLRILLEMRGKTLADVSRLYLAGAFGNYLDLDAARRIGLLQVDADRIEPVGNTALRGTKLYLLQPSRREFFLNAVPAMTRHLSLNEHPAFQDLYVDSMAFG